MRRVCDKSSGIAIWVTNESAKKMEDEGMVESGTEKAEEVERLNLEVSRLKLENDALNMSGAESRGVSTPNKLRDEVEAMRE